MIVPSPDSAQDRDHSLYRPPEALRLRGVSDSTHDCESDIRALGSAFRCFRLGSSACLRSRVARRLRIVRSRIAPRAIEPGAGFREGPICQAAAQGRSGIIPAILASAQTNPASSRAMAAFTTLAGLPRPLGSGSTAVKPAVRPRGSLGDVCRHARRIVHGCRRRRPQGPCVLPCRLHEEGPHMDVARPGDPAARDALPAR